MPAEQEDLHSEYSGRWEEKFWGKEGGLQKGEAFDAGHSSPALTHLLTTGQLSVKGKNVFVPGCGRGYDLISFVKHGASLAVGLELAPTAQKEAAQYVAEQLSAEEAPKAEVFAGDFYKWQHPSGASWEVAYDYTFFCAMHPDMRQDWAAAWGRHLRPGAQLVCLAFPLIPEGTAGPPWPVTTQLYKDLLVPQGFVCEHDEPVPAELSHPARGGKEHMLIFRRQ